MYGDLSASLVASKVSLSFLSGPLVKGATAARVALSVSSSVKVSSSSPRSSSSGGSEHAARRGRRAELGLELVKARRLALGQHAEDVAPVLDLGGLLGRIVVVLDLLGGRLEARDQLLPGRCRCTLSGVVGSYPTSSRISGVAAARGEAALDGSGGGIGCESGGGTCCGSGRASAARRRHRLRERRHRLRERRRRARRGRGDELGLGDEHRGAHRRRRDRHLDTRRGGAAGCEAAAP